MGWDYVIGINMDAPKVNTSQRLIDLIQKMASYSPFDVLPYIVIRKLSLIRSNMGFWDRAIVEEIGLESISKLAQIAENILTKYPEDDYIYEAVWVTHRYWPRAEEPFELTDGAGVSLYSADEKVDIYPGSSQMWAIYDVGSFKYYDGITNIKTTTMNIAILRDELEIMAKCGVDHMIGYSYEDDPNPHPKDYSLCYHANVSGFLNDICKIHGEELELYFTKNDILTIANNIGDIIGMDFGPGILIYSKFGSVGRLDKFYNALYEYRQKH